jgi:hypothetical protein
MAVKKNEHRAGQGKDMSIDDKEFEQLTQQQPTEYDKRLMARLRFLHTILVLGFWGVVIGIVAFIVQFLLHL